MCPEDDMDEPRAAEDPFADAPGKGGPLAPGLYVVATPIGNLGDMTDRAKAVLAQVDLIACEDTRVTQKLLSYLMIRKPMLPYHEHNGPAMRPKLLEKLAGGARIALVSDAGTPLISDPGFKLVDAVCEAGHRVTPIPGPSAAITALSVAGLPTDRFLFMGFPPAKAAARRDWFEAEKTTRASLVFYESARRLPESLRDAADVLGPRPAAVARELTKKFEEVRRDDLISLADHYEAAGAPKGEIVVVIGASEEKASTGTAIDADKALKLALGHMSTKSAARFVADLLGLKRKDLYDRALEIGGKHGGED